MGSAIFYHYHSPERKTSKRAYYYTILHYLGLSCLSSSPPIKHERTYAWVRTKHGLHGGHEGAEALLITGPVNNQGASKTVFMLGLPCAITALDQAGAEVGALKDGLHGGHGGCGSAKHHRDCDTRIMIAAQIMAKQDPGGAPKNGPSWWA